MEEKTNKGSLKPTGKDYSKGRAPRKNWLLITMITTVLILSLILIVLLVIAPIIQNNFADNTADSSDHLELSGAEAHESPDTGSERSDNDSLTVEPPGEDIADGSTDEESASNEEAVGETDEGVEASAESLPQAIPNQPPLITGINFSPSPIFTNKSVTMTALASDPDGDTLSFNWEVLPDLTGRVFDYSLPRENPTSLVFPNAPCNVMVKVTVSDDHGNESEFTDTVRVNPIAKIAPLNAETGWITSKPAVFCPSHVYVGDTDDNRISRGFISFDISALAGKNIYQAELQLNNPQVINTPAFMTSAIDSKKSGLTVEEVSWGRRALNAADYSLPGSFISNQRGPTILVTSINGGTNPKLAEALQRCLNERNSRFQLRVRFENEISDNDSTDDGVIYQTSNIGLIVWYLE